MATFSHFRQLYYKLVFVNADDPSEKLYVQDIEGAQHDINVPDKPGYKINSLIFKYEDATLYKDVKDGKFDLTLDIIKNSAQNFRLNKIKVPFVSNKIKNKTCHCRKNQQILQIKLYSFFHN